MRTSAWILVFALALGGCGKKSEDKGGGTAPAAEPAGGGGGGGGAKAAALKAAFEASADCQSLVKCCAEIVGTGWVQTIGPICEQVKTMQNFEEQANNLVDPEWQGTACTNALQAASMMGNDANPVPASCAAAPAAAPAAP
jgi:hypothetical protein